MSIPEFEQMLHAVLPSTGKTSLTLTEVPRHEGELLVLLEKAVLSGARSNTPLTEIHLPKDAYPAMEAEFGDIPVMDSGHADVIRLFFEP
ncbi:MULTISPECIES: hypothetical protein [unclassified Beijerinckia]|uniref:hypothetical protein n=1 Tax=unclassified Beijerinckia TaxID=2638183 RepID=UPI0008970D5C|nr:MULTISPECIES: hypothetical protein [unclassified Beijerinckia]MDH7798189.1 hypothetical protein [Beijerinckia sp. GAS462]SED12227.1 hypothetical protein SAMN05443249_4483 [Beijerinckia sp. 28-YEA-48]